MEQYQRLSGSLGYIPQSGAIQRERMLGRRHCDAVMVAPAAIRNPQAFLRTLKLRTTILFFLESILTDIALFASVAGGFGHSPFLRWVGLVQSKFISLAKCYLPS
jgi:hypothetical protein